MNEVVKFKSAGLPAASLGQFQRQAQQLLQQTRDQLDVGGSSFLRLNKNDGLWVYGQDKIEIEPGSLWAVNIMSLQHGLIAWPPGESPLKQPLKSMRYIFDTTQAPIDASLIGRQSTNGGAWESCIAFELLCVGGTDPNYTYDDEGETLEYQQNSDGGKRAFDALCVAIMKQIGTDPANCVPVIELKSESYQHQKWGKQYKPVFEIVRWVGLAGPANDTAPISPPEADHDAEAAAEAANEAAEAAAAAAAARVRAAVQNASTTPQTPPAASGRRNRGGASQASQASQPVAETPAQTSQDAGTVQRRRRRG